MAGRVPTHSDLPLIGQAVTNFRVAPLDATPASPLQILADGPTGPLVLRVERNDAQELMAKLVDILRVGNSQSDARQRRPR
jgi:hypothetical protein